MASSGRCASSCPQTTGAAKAQTLKEQAVDLQTYGLFHLEQSPAVKPLSFGDLGTSLSVHFSSLLSFPLVSQYLLPRVQFLWMLKISRGCFYIPSCKDITRLWGLEGEGRGIRTKVIFKTSTLGFLVFGKFYSRTK